MNNYWNKRLPWEGLGQDVSQATNSAEAMKLGGLDWEIKTQPVYTPDLTTGEQIVIPNTYANVRSDNNMTLGITTKRYKTINNVDAFAFTDSIIDDIDYETAGYLNDGKQVWLMAKFNETKVLGEDFGNYLAFYNSHDGKSSLKICVCNVRVFCANMLNIAMDNAQRSWTITHNGLIDKKLEGARQTLEHTHKYLTAFATMAEELAGKKVSPFQLNAMTNTLFPMPLEEGRGRTVVERQRALFDEAMNKDDLSNFRGTAYQIVNAISDLVTHATPTRMTPTYQENNFAKMISGHDLFDKTVRLVKTA